MNEKYMIADDGFENILEDGKTIGYRILIRIPYYRGIALSLVDNIELAVDGWKIPREDIRLKTRCGYAFSLNEIETVSRYRWEYGEKAELIVLKDGGLKPGQHTIELKVFLRISYMPKGSFSQATSDLVMPA